MSESGFWSSLRKLRHRPILRDRQFRLRDLVQRADPALRFRSHPLWGRPRIGLAIACLLLTALLLAPNPYSNSATAEIDFTRRGVMPYQAFDQLSLQQLKVGGTLLQVGFAPGSLDLPQQRYLDWVQRSADALATYYGRFPAGEARILVVPVNGKGVRFGQAFGHGGPAVKVLVGRQSDWNDLTSDWIMVHEMIHLAFPQLSRRHSWLSEGLAVYVESIARVQAGHLTQEAIWKEFAERMPHGLPKSGDQGLDNTGTWGRTYWGGAIFCLIADVEIRKRTNNRFGLQDALKAVIAAGGSLDQDWSVPKALAAADAGIGVPVLMELYDQMRDQPVTPDLAALWRDLGLRFDGAEIHYDETADLAAIRRAITARTTDAANSGGG